MGHEQIASFSFGPIYKNEAAFKLNVYAESETHYEPPGYIYFEIKWWGKTKIPQRRFMGIGVERKPKQNFTLVTTKDDEIVALLLNNEVQMIHELSSGFTWPGPYTNVTEPQWQMAELLLQKLRATKPDIRCPRQEDYRKELDRELKQ
ncbi:hypothetical protein [Gimesia aquarii]|uniref:hypothetical protein n=1 Tax=Gimesia aquarii TaxID=2527964 RepID=UPI0011A167E2|nr:hypothetical protein [Gimesia aquarii]